MGPTIAAIKKYFKSFSFLKKAKYTTLIVNNNTSRIRGYFQRRDIVINQITKNVANLI